MATVAVRAAFQRLFVPQSLRWITARGPGSAAFPVLCYVMTRMWPTSWILGLLSFVAIFTQRFSACWSLAMAQWTVLQEMRWLKVPAKGHKPGALPRNLPLPSLRPQPQQEADGVPSRQPDEGSRPAEELHVVPLSPSPFPPAPTGSLGIEEECFDPGENTTVRHMRRRRSRRADEPAPSTFGEEARTAPFSRALKRFPGDSCEEEDDEKAVEVTEALLDTKPDAAAEALLSWWGGPESEGHERVGQRGEDSSGLRVNKLLLSAIVFGPPAALSALLVSYSLPMDTADDPRFSAPVHYNLLVHADVFLRLLLGGIKCVHIAWLFGIREQAERVGLLPLVVLGCGVVAAMSVPLFRKIFSFNVSVSVFLLIVLPVTFAGLTLLIVMVQTAASLRHILAEGKGPVRRKRSRRGGRGYWKGLHRSGARSLSLPLRYAPLLPREPSSACSSRESRFLINPNSSPLERSIWWPALRGRIPLRGKAYERMRIAYEEGRKRKDPVRWRGKSRRARRVVYVTKLYVRFLKSNLYWAFIGNVEMLRANLNMALSGSPSRPIPMIWGWLLKFVATPWLLMELVEHLAGIIPLALADVRGARVSMAYILLGWIVLIIAITLFGKPTTLRVRCPPAAPYLQAHQTSTPAAPYPQAHRASTCPANKCWEGAAFVGGAGAGWVRLMA